MWNRDRRKTSIYKFEIKIWRVPSQIWKLIKQWDYSKFKHNEIRNESIIESFVANRQYRGENKKGEGWNVEEDSWKNVVQEARSCELAWKT